MTCQGCEAGEGHRGEGLEAGRKNKGGRFRQVGEEVIRTFEKKQERLGWWSIDSSIQNTS